MSKLSMAAHLGEIDRRILAEEIGAVKSLFFSREGHEKVVKLLQGLFLGDFTRQFDDQSRA
jgi:hypothetical protein